MNGQSLLVLLIVGGVAGWLAGLVMRGSGYGIIGDVIVGLLGAFIGNYLVDAFHISVKCKRPTNDRRTRHRFPLDGRRVGQRRYRVGFIAAAATFQGSSASISARVVACGSFSKIKRR